MFRKKTEAVKPTLIRVVDGWYLIQILSSKFACTLESNFIKTSEKSWTKEKKKEKKAVWRSSNEGMNKSRDTSFYGIKEYHRKPSEYPSRCQPQRLQSGRSCCARGRWSSTRGCRSGSGCARSCPGASSASPWAGSGQTLPTLPWSWDLRPEAPYSTRTDGIFTFNSPQCFRDAFLVRKRTCKATNHGVQSNEIVVYQLSWKMHECVKCKFEQKPTGQQNVW